EYGSLCWRKGEWSTSRPWFSFRVWSHDEPVDAALIAHRDGPLQSRARLLAVADLWLEGSKSEFISVGKTCKPLQLEAIDQTRDLSSAGTVEAQVLRTRAGVVPLDLSGHT